MLIVKNVAACLCMCATFKAQKPAHIIDAPCITWTHQLDPVQVMRAFCEEWEVNLGVKITLSHEDEPLGTAGPLALARETLDDGSGEPFFVMNSDVICAYPLADMMAHHKRKGAEATLLVTKARAACCAA